jgi:hypothetical protein
MFAKGPTNTLAYKEHRLFKALKSFITLAPRLYHSTWVQILD